MEKICCFTGHRNISDSDRAAVTAALRTLLPDLIKDGVTVFRTGGALGFDTLAAEEILRLKKNFPEVKLHIYVPCLDQNKYYSPEQKAVYLRHINAADKIMCISKSYYDGCMLDRNKEMVNGSALCIAYIRRQSGGTAFTVRYAEKNGVKVVRV
ncbi:MAG: DUF1273 family protein [Oscillospiraceae bacterium]|nr:DUF1273 family protein [Oscillospiraceae bacterium]